LRPTFERSSRGFLIQIVLASMKVAGLTAYFLCIGTLLTVVRPSTPVNSNSFDRLFDEYGLIRWEDEQARLDNFAIQLSNERDSIGYIFIYDGENVCAGEARARAIRARKYVVEHRHVPWHE
jgi:hypothetical protein